jgi:hypothetical protein
MTNIIKQIICAQNAYLCQIKPVKILFLFVPRIMKIVNRRTQHQKQGFTYQVYNRRLASEKKKKKSLRLKVLVTKNE